MTVTTYTYFICSDNSKLRFFPFQLRTKLVHRERNRHQAAHDMTLPNIIPIKATSTSREMGFATEQQEHLAQDVMCHRKETSDRYYDKSQKTSKRKDVTRKLRSHYKAYHSFLWFRFTSTECFIHTVKILKYG